MAWNDRTAKTLPRGETKGMALGTPVSDNPSMTGRPYRDGWDIQRAYRDGVKKVVWLFRAIDAIAGNAARLTVQYRKDNDPKGEIVVRDDTLQLLNTRANPGEDSFAFRYRLSAQLLTSTRGAFVEIVRGRGGKPIALHLLPPEYTAPIPDPKRFVASFEVRLPTGNPIQIRPEDVLWFKHPHPIDPYLSMTPMESAGIAIEIENLAKHYNRNFLLNDGRPGGLVVVRGEMDDDDKEELRARFGWGPSRAGHITVLAAEDGVDFVDTAASPRDAAYMEMRRITKEEILAAFGVPESVIGNAAGRTFSNAAEEGKVFWNETMGPHLEMLARGFDSLNPQYLLEFDMSTVPVLILAKQERDRFYMDEFHSGLVTANEYREATGRKKVESYLADSMLANPNLAPIGSTAKKMVEPEPVGAAGVPGQPLGMQPGMAPGTTPAAEPAPEPATAPLATPPPSVDMGLDADMAALGMGKTQSDSLSYKTADAWDTKAAQDTDRWTAVLEHALERLLERQQRVVLEKAGGQKVRRAIAQGDLDVSLLFDKSVWDKQYTQDLRPVLAGIVHDAANTQVPQHPTDVSDQEIQQYLDEQTARVVGMNDTLRREVEAAVLVALALQGSDEERHGLLRTAIVAAFVAWLMKRKRRIAEHEAQTAYNAGVYFAAKRLDGSGPNGPGMRGVAADGNGPRSGPASGAASAAGAAAAADGGSGPSGGLGTGITKTWLTRSDDAVRPEHRVLHGKSIPADKGFLMDGATLRFPGDPLAPPHLTIGCRCRLRYRR